VRYWDSSALLPLVVQEPTTVSMQRLLKADHDVLTWWATRVEAASALARLAREGAMDDRTVQAAFTRLDALARTWDEVLPHDSVRDHATRLLRVHPLRAADALQLASALTASEHRPETLPLVTLDARLGEAARREGFSVLPAG
jgi:predicted nucleic acid-binding protein